MLGTIILTTLLWAARFPELTRAYTRQRDPALSMPQELLNGLYIYPVRLQQRAEGMAEGVPADVLGNAGLTCHRPDIPLHEIVWSVGLFPLHARTGKDPVTLQRYGLERRQRRRFSAMYSPIGTGFAEASVSQTPTTHARSIQ